MYTRKFNNRKRTKGRNYKFVAYTTTEKIKGENIEIIKARRITIESKMQQFINRKIFIKYGNY